MENLKKELNKLKNPEEAKILSRFFKTGKGEYGEGDIFLGIKVPILRQISKKYQSLSLVKIGDLLESKIHEHRMCALIILTEKYQKSSLEEKTDIFNFYLKNTRNINNWDLVDLSAPKIIGDFLLKRKREILYDLAKSEMLWERRISIISTFAFIRNNDFEDTIKISTLLLKDKEDLIHKAVGWMLREIGKRDENILEEFLEKNYKIMPRIMLRYSIEKFSPRKRKYFLKK